MSPLYKRLHENTAILGIQSGGNRLPVKKSLKTNLHFRRNTLWPLNSQLKRLWSRLVSRSAAVEMVVALEEGHLPGQIYIVTSVVKGDISRKTAGQRKIAPVGTHPRSPQMIFRNGWLISLFSQIPSIWQQPPWPAKTRITSGAPLAIMFRVHGDFTGRMAMMSGNISKSRSHMFVFTILPPIQ